MPLTDFICPDGERIKVGDCLEQCRMKERCLTIPTLIKASDAREWDGTPHVTQLISGTMQEYLKVVHDYAVDPRSMIFASLGQAHHAELDEIASEMGLPSEDMLKFFNPGILQGRADYLEEDIDQPDPTQISYILVDYKTWGSFKVAKALGIKRNKVAGKWMTLSVPADDKDTELQLNAYRIALESKGIKITKMRIQATVRDGSTQISRQRGIEHPAYMIPVRRWEDSFIESYFNIKGQMLVGALNGQIPPTMCTDEERWGDTKCKFYCEVAEFCEHGKTVS